MPDDTPIYDFGKFKAALECLGYTIGTAKPYVPLKVADVNLSNIQDGELEIDDLGNFFVTSRHGNHQQVFLYKKRYYMSRYGEKPRYHIKYCSILKEHSSDEYRRANTGTVIVWDNDLRKNIEVSELSLCKNCLSLLRAERQLEYNSDMTSNEFEQVLRAASEDTDCEEEPDIDLEGYTWKWQKISEAYRTKKQYTCEICGFTPENRMDRQFIHVHHKDGIKTHNKESNLQCLCIACHSNVNPTHQKNFSKGANRVILDAFKKKYPNAGNSNMNTILEDFCKAWQTLDANLITQHLDDDFRYDSQWVFASLDCNGYKDYIKGKFETIKKSNTHLDVSIVSDSHSSIGKMLRITQDGGEPVYYRIEVREGKVIKGDLCAF